MSSSMVRIIPYIMENKIHVETTNQLIYGWGNRWEGLQVSI